MEHETAKSPLVLPYPLKISGFALRCRPIVVFFWFVINVILLCLHFQISQVYFHQDEPTDIRNMKKAILSALSMKFAGQGIRFPVNETFTVSIVLDFRT